MDDDLTEISTWCRSPQSGDFVRPLIVCLAIHIFNVTGAHACVIPTLVLVSRDTFAADDDWGFNGLPHYFKLICQRTLLLVGTLLRRMNLSCVVPVALVLSLLKY
jgi:hypothetical protein